MLYEVITIGQFVPRCPLFELPLIGDGQADIGEGDDVAIPGDRVDSDGVDPGRPFAVKHFDDAFRRPGLHQRRQPRPARGHFAEVEKTFVADEKVADAGMYADKLFERFIVERL